jgi:hypothetical protein
MSTSHIVEPQRADVADHAAPVDDERDRAERAATVAQYASTLLPGALWALGMFVFDGPVPTEVQGTVGLIVTALCTLVVGYSRSRG